jgi:4-alpha-glucanotransferase
MSWIERSAGVLLHPGSLPSGGINGDATHFMEFCADAGFGVWQILPAGPVDAHGSPYQSDSAVAGNMALLGPGMAPGTAQVAAFAEANADWLPDYALFAALERHLGSGWNHWPQPLRDRDPGALRDARREYAPDIARTLAGQCAFEMQWAGFKQRLNERGLLLFGDVPLFVSHHSADVWMHRHLFDIDPDGSSAAVVGVPPDAFAADGQWWGYPAYSWTAMASEDYRWWRRRFEIHGRRYDLIRLDHFRGFAATWHIPRGLPVRDGHWVAGPGRAAIDALAPVLRRTQLVAEDLGHITPDVVELRHALQIPGMRVLQFAFDGDPDNAHLPHRHEPDSVCYTGTHDNDTTLGWWNASSEGTRELVRRHLGTTDPLMPDALVDWAWSSPAPLAIVPMQDLLGLGTEARMNTPGREAGNWTWRFAWDAVPSGLAEKLRERLARHARLPGNT